MTARTGGRPHGRYTDAQLYAAYERLGSGVLVAAEMGLSQSYVALRLRTYRRDVLGIAGKSPRLSRSPRAGFAVGDAAGAVNGAPGAPLDLGSPAGQPSAAGEAGGATAEPAEPAEREDLREALARVEARIEEMTAALRAVAARPPTVVEWRPQTRRIKDGGVHASAQRAMIALPRRREKRDDGPDAL